MGGLAFRPYPALLPRRSHGRASSTQVKVFALNVRDWQSVSDKKNQTYILMNNYYNSDQNLYIDHFACILRTFV
jgi:hypothetical protein